ncbi:hypothetical protein E4U30_005980 [Claviceps sp. LM220 group G6]|nr:hypothetical protein E4U15_007317 [Claviceps sp. LM218 group G6]KAG6102369.1 hypothetical protein E4U14_006656 [Claviceps sp. LM454 group G7]KAG6102503.1 hypothetical protein E4U30_005980 [Claviceps sp. LM220 group G6]KAG6105048.1 hypothetical protein E4U31_001627 [Claviceps sp. LM219 group G6]
MKFLTALSFASLALAAPSLPGPGAAAVQETDAVNSTATATKERWSSYGNGYFECPGYTGGVAACCGSNYGYMSYECTLAGRYGCYYGASVCCTYLRGGRGYFCKNANTGW